MQKLVETILLVLFAFTLETTLQTAASGLTMHPTERELFEAIWANPRPYTFGLLQGMASVITLCRFFFGASGPTRDWYFDPEKWKRETRQLVAQC
jgi:hypothetical protein